MFHLIQNVTFLLSLTTKFQNEFGEGDWMHTDEGEKNLAGLAFRWGN